MGAMITITFAGDEAGDVSFNFGKGASRYFVPAFIATQEPDALRETLAELRLAQAWIDQHWRWQHRPRP